MKQRILFILHLPPPVHGAAMVGKYIQDSELINGKFECRYVNLTTAQSLEDIGKASLGKVKRFFRLLKEIRKQIKEFKPHLIYITPNAKGGAFYKEFIVVEMVKSMGCKVIIHYHNKGVSTRQDRWLDNILYRKFFKGIKVILLGKSLYEDVRKYVKWEDVYICPNGIPGEGGWKKDDVRRLKDDEKRRTRLLFLSNLIESKGVLVLLDALKMLKEKGYVFSCDFVGGETKEINAKRFNKELAVRGLQGRAQYRGKKYGEEKEDAYRKADVFVFPTYNETFGLVNLEAMQHALPCISTNEGAISDIIEDGVNGLIAKRKDACSLANKIETLLNDKELRIRMGEQGYLKFQREFTLERFEKRMCEILSQL